MNLFDMIHTRFKKKAFWESMLIYLVFIVIMCLLLSFKINYHVDELLSYGLANRDSSQAWFDEGVTYIPAQSPWISFITVKGREYAFDWKNVWANQAADVHPPFYYVILHSICSVFQGKFSMWFAGIINIIFAILTLYIVKKMVYELTGNRNMVSIVSIFFVLSGGILYSVLFLRMYVMTMFLVSLVTWLFLYATKLKRLSWRLYANLILISYIGALTHYYFIVYLFFICLVFGIWLLVYKRYSEAISFVFSMGLSGVLAVKTFPSMVKHMFMGSGRGVQSVENLRKGSLSDYVERIGSFYQFINERLFGRILTYAILVIVFLWIFSKQIVWEDTSGISGEETIVNEIGQNKKRINWLLMSIPSICYFLLVSKIAVFITDRYLYPAYAVIFVWVLCGLFSLGRGIVRKRYWAIISGLLLAIIVVNSWQACSGLRMYRDSDKIFTKAKAHASCNCLYIYDTSWKALQSFLEASHYKSVTFYNENNIESLADMQYLADKEMMVFITNSCDTQEVLKYIMEVCPNLNTYQEISSFGYATSYYLYEEEASI